MCDREMDRQLDKQVALMLQLYDVVVSDESMLLLEFVFVYLNVSGWGIGRTLGLFSLPLSLSATVGLWFEQCRSNATAWHHVRKDRSVAKKYWLECLIWQRRWRLSNHRKKEIRSALYSPTAAHATGNEEKQKNTKSLGKILKSTIVFICWTDVFLQCFSPSYIYSVLII